MDGIIKLFARLVSTGARKIKYTGLNALRINVRSTFSSCASKTLSGLQHLGGVRIIDGR